MKYGLIGGKLGHSFSPEIHKQLGGYEYELRELGPEELEGFILGRSFDGINVTMPYKQAVIPLLDEISDAAREIGAVNTVVNRGGRLFGYNTDCDGLEMLIKKAGMDLSGKKVIIAGSGGTSRTAAYAARELGASEIIRLSRSGRDGAATYEEAYEKHGDADFIINTTPAGMYPDVDSSALDIDRFTGLKGVVDVVYNPLTTRIVDRARSKGIKAANGLYMLVAQAAAASELFTGNDVSPADTDRVFQSLMLEKSNIVLTGMPGSGKSTAGKLLASKLGRPLISTDDEIIASEGMPITEIFRQYGEEFFRDAETEIIRGSSMTGGKVISTGGGAVLRDENVRLLKMNGIVVFLDRDPKKLRPSGDRPLADSREKVMKLYEERYPVYTAAADLTVAVRGTPEETAEDIWRAISWT